MLGRYLASGAAGKPDPVEARLWLERAIAQGVPDEGLQANSPPACGRRAGCLQDVSRSELGRQVAVNFESDADLHECGSCPVHSRSPAFHNDQQP